MVCKVQNDRRRCKKCQMAAAAAEQRLFAAAGKCSSMLLQESELGQLRNAEKCREIQRSTEKYREVQRNTEYCSSIQIQSKMHSMLQ